MIDIYTDDSKMGLCLADRLTIRFQVFQGDAPPGYVNIKYLEKALGTYSNDKQVSGSDKLNIQYWMSC